MRRVAAGLLCALLAATAAAAPAHRLMREAEEDLVVLSKPEK